MQLEQILLLTRIETQLTNEDPSRSKVELQF